MGEEEGRWEKKEVERRSGGGGGEEGRGQPMCILVQPPSNKRLCHQ